MTAAGSARDYKVVALSAQLDLTLSFFQGADSHCPSKTRQPLEMRAGRR